MWLFPRARGEQLFTAEHAEFFLLQVLIWWDQSGLVLVAAEWTFLPTVLKLNCSEGNPITTNWVPSPDWECWGISKPTSTIPHCSVTTSRLLSETSRRGLRLLSSHCPVWTLLLLTWFYNPKLQVVSDLQGKNNSSLRLDKQATQIFPEFLSYYSSGFAPGTEGATVNIATSLQRRLNISERQFVNQQIVFLHCPAVSKQLCQTVFWEDQLFRNVCKGAASWDRVFRGLLLISCEMSGSTADKVSRDEEVWVWWDVTGRERLSVKWHLSTKQKKAGEWVMGHPRGEHSS